MGKVDVSKLKPAAKKVAARRKKQIYAAKKRVAVRTATRRAMGVDVITWEALDSPLWRADFKKRPLLQKCLGMPPRSSIRRLAQDKLAKEFARVYRDYRRCADALRGRTGATYEVRQGDMKYAKQAALNCFHSGITPQTLIMYWHENVKNFKGSMEVPTLSFLSSNAICDTVLCSSKGVTKVGEITLDDAVARPEFGNNFAALDPRVRTFLASKGFEVSDLDDDRLINVQANARSYAEGYRPYVPNKRDKKLARVLKELYQK